jgi:hypothetical protein
VAGAVLLASFGFFAPAYAGPLVTGPLSINGSLAVLGLVAIDDSLMVPGDIHARGPITAIWIERILADDSAVRRRWGITRFRAADRARRSGNAWPITVGCPAVPSGVWMRRARLPGAVERVSGEMSEGL